MNAVEAAKEKYEKKREKQAEIEASKEANEEETQKKDFTREKEAVEIGKIASKMAADLRERAIVTGWSAAQYSTEMTVEVTKAATTMVEEAVEYLGQKAYELAAKSVDTATGLAAATGENAKEYTARKKEEAERALEAKRETQNQANETVVDIKVKGEKEKPQSPQYEHADMKLD